LRKSHKNANRIWEDEEINYLIENIGKKDIENAKKLERTLNSVRSKRRNLGYNKKYNPKYQINLDFFKKWGEDMAYLLGFIFGDGSIRIRNKGSELTMKSIDQDLLQSINKVMDSNYKIRKTKENRKLYRLTILRQEIVNDLLKLGVVPNKSLVMKFPIIPDKYLFHFIRGYFDADGHIRIVGNCVDIIFTSGSKSFLDSLSRRLKIFDIKSRVHTQDKYNWSYLNILNESREDFYNNLYKDAGIHLKRKYELFLTFFRNHHIPTIKCIDCSKRIVKTGNNQKRCNICKKENIRHLNRLSYQKKKSRN